MKAYTKIIGITMLAILLVGFGAAVAMWYDTLKVNTYINTGTVKVKWSEWYCSDTGPDPQAPGFNNTEGKDVASCMVEPEINDTDNNTIKLKVNITNAYPGYAVNITMVVDNIGTIPVKLLNHTFSNWTSEDDEALNVTLYIPDDTQIHAGENLTIIMEIVVLQNATQDHDYFFDVEFIFAQWNEVP
jgi:hypothetical protein